MSMSVKSGWRVHLGVYHYFDGKQWGCREILFNPIQSPEREPTEEDVCCPHCCALWEVTKKRDKKLKTGQNAMEKLGVVENKNVAKRGWYTFHDENHFHDGTRFGCNGTPEPTSKHSRFPQPGVKACQACLKFWKEAEVVEDQNATVKLGVEVMQTPSIQELLQQRDEAFNKVKKLEKTLEETEKLVIHRTNTEERIKFLEDEIARLRKLQAPMPYHQFRAVVEHNAPKPPDGGGADLFNLVHSCFGIEAASIGDETTVADFRDKVASRLLMIRAYLNNYIEHMDNSIRTYAESGRLMAKPS